MRRRFALTDDTHNTFGRLFIVALAVASLGLMPQVASALTFTSWTVTEVGYEQWMIEGNIDVLGEDGETADISFGGAIAGGSTTTDLFGDFAYIFSAPYGSTISFSASTATEQTPTEEWVLFDPDGLP